MLLFCFTALCDWFKTRQFFNQSDLKKSETNCNSTCWSRFLALDVGCMYLLGVLIGSLLLSSVVIGQSDNFGFGFTTLIVNRSSRVHSSSLMPLIRFQSCSLTILFVQSCSQAPIHLCFQEIYKQHDCTIFFSVLLKVKLLLKPLRTILTKYIFFTRTLKEGTFYV